MAIQQRTIKRGSIVHADHGVQFTSWAFTDKVRRAGLMPSFGSVGDAFDNAMMESFWSTMQIELLDRKPRQVRQGTVRRDPSGRDVLEQPAETFRGQAGTGVRSR